MDFIDSSTISLPPLPRYRDITCYACHERGHYAAECPHQISSAISGLSTSGGGGGGGMKVNRAIRSSTTSSPTSSPGNSKQIGTQRTHNECMTEGRLTERPRHLYKRRTCRYWLNGNCRQGAECPFGHELYGYETGSVRNGRTYGKNMGAYGLPHHSMQTLYGPATMMYPPPRLPTHAPYTPQADYTPYYNQSAMGMPVPRSYMHPSVSAAGEEMKDERNGEKEGPNENGMMHQYSASNALAAAGGNYYNTQGHPMGMPTPAPLPPYSQYGMHPYLMNTSAMMHPGTSSYGMPYINYHHYSQPMQQPYKPSMPPSPPSEPPEVSENKIENEANANESLVSPAESQHEAVERTEEKTNEATVDEQEQELKDVSSQMKGLDIDKTIVLATEPEQDGEQAIVPEKEVKNQINGRRKEKKKLYNGLANETGQNNCFLNVVVQALYHSSRFQELFAAVTDHSCKSEKDCIYCVLRELFNKLDDENPDADISSTPLRDLLRQTSSSASSYVAGSMDDAAEAFEIILNLLHDTLTSSKDACSFQSVISSHQDPCLVHRCFGMYFKETATCPRCHQAIKGIKYETTTRFFPATVFYEHQKKQVTPPLNFSQILAKTLIGDSKKCHNARCVNSKPIQSCIHLVSLPGILTIGLSWPSTRPKNDMLEGIVKAISTEIAFADLFKECDSKMEQSKAQLDSMLCYAGHHYIVFIYENEEWYLFDDQKIKRLGNDFNSVIDACLNGHYQPLLLLYTVLDKMMLSSISTSDSVVKEELKDTFEFMVGDIVMTVSKEENEQRWKYTKTNSK